MTEDEMAGWHHGLDGRESESQLFHSPLREKKISNEMSPTTLLYLKYFLLQFIHVPSLSKNKELMVDNKDKKHK